MTATHFSVKLTEVMMPVSSITSGGATASSSSALLSLLDADTDCLNARRTITVKNGTKKLSTAVSLLRCARMGTRAEWRLRYLKALEDEKNKY